MRDNPKYCYISELFWSSSETLMSFKKPYLAIALVGVAAASGAAWWLQNKPAQTAEMVATAANNSGPATNAAGAPASGPAAGGAAAGGAGGPAKPTAVEVTQVEKAMLVDETQSVGSLKSNQGVVLRPEVGGRVSQVLFKDGQRVKKGQLLVQFDDQLPVAQVMQATAELSIAQANHKRNQELVAQNFISKRSLDESDAALQVAQAKLALAQATLQRLKVFAPFDGVAGLRQINVGDYLKDGADMVNIEDIEAVLLDFRLAERFQTKVKPGQKAEVTFDALPGRKFTAIIQAIDPLIDANGRSVGIRGCIDNRQMQLRPGMFARVNAVFGERADAMVIPEEAIVPQGGRTFVVKVVPGPNKDELVSERVNVKIGLRQPGKVEILEGLSLGDSVVIAGQQRLQKDGTLVRIIDPSKGQAAANAPAGGPANAAGAAPGNAPGGPNAGKPAESTQAKGADKGAEKGADKGKGKPKMPPVTGENPCARGLNAAR
ncbi:MAG: Multidrug resistance protein MdtA precursor [Pseudomonadota bacterium]|jgi:membrane fusion protein (multidrug efflux system)